MTSDEHSTAAYWELDGSRARLSAGAFSGVIDVERPDRGLAELRFDGAPLTGYLLGVGVESAKPPAANARWEPNEFYARGRDLVVTYREPFGEPFNVQVYWRFVESTYDGPVLDAIVSIQTPQWEAYPSVSIGSALGDENALVLQEAVAHRATPQWACIEVARPGDFSLDAQTARWHYGGMFMERGVIRRLHLRTGFAPWDDRDAFARQLRSSLLEEQPPLTA